MYLCKIIKQNENNTVEAKRSISPIGFGFMCLIIHQISIKNTDFSAISSLLIHHQTNRQYIA